MERGAHTHIYTSTLSRRERAWRGRRRHWARLSLAASMAIVACAAALTAAASHLL